MINATNNINSAQQSTIGYSEEQLNKLGNTLIYLSNHINDLSKTKILKILFLLEEASIKKFGYPFFDIDFQIWRHGPVAKDIYIDLSDECPTLLKDFIQKDDDNPSFFKGKGDFNDDEFSQNDMELLKIITDFAKNKMASVLVKHTHAPNSLWTKSALKHGILEQLEKGLISSTNFAIDFELLFDGDQSMLDRFSSAKENRQFIRALKS